MAGKEFNLRLIFQVLDRATAPMRKVGAAINRVGKATGLDKVAQASGALFTGLGRVGREAVAFGARMTAATAAAGGALFALVKRFTGGADRLAKTADKLGLPVKTLQQLRYAAGLAGVEQGKLDIATQRFTRRVAEAAAGTGVAKDALAALGIQLKDGNGNIRSTEELLFDVADKMAAIEDPAKRVRLAFTLFDSEGVDMVNMLSKGSAAMRETFAEAVKLGVVTEQDARKSEQFNDELTKLFRVIGNVGDIIAAHLLPSMQQGVVWLRNFVIEMRPAAVEKMSAAIEEISAIVALTAATWSDWTGHLDTWMQAAILISPMITAIVARATGFIRSMGMTRIVIGLVATALGAKLLFAIAALFAPLTKVVLALVGVTVKMTVLASKGVAAMIAGLVKFLPMIGSMVAATWAWTAALLANPLTWIAIGILVAIAAIVGGMYLLIRHWDTVTTFFRDSWNTVKAAFTDAWAGIVSDLTAIWSRITAAFEDGPVSGILQLLATFSPVTLFARAIDAIIEHLTGVSLLEEGGRLIDGLRAGIVTRAQTVLAYVRELVSQIVDLVGGIDLVAAGGRIVAGLRSGIAQGATSITDRIATLATGILDGFAGIDMVTAGGRIIAGLRSGIARAATSITDRIATLATGILDGFAGIDLVTAGGRIIVGLRSGIARAATSITDRIAALAAEILDVIGGVDLLAAGGAIMGGLLGGLIGGLPGVSTWLSAAASGLTANIPADALTTAGGALVGGMLTGIKGAWGDVIEWLNGAIDGLDVWLEGRLDELLGWIRRKVDQATDFLPDWIKDEIGLPVGGGDAAGNSALTAPVPSALGPGSQEIGGEIRVRFDNAPQNMRVTEKRSRNRGISLGVDAGYAMGQ